MKERTESQIPECHRDDGVGEEMVMEFFCGKVPFSERVKYYTTGDCLTKE